VSGELGFGQSSSQNFGVLFASAQAIKNFVDIFYQILVTKVHTDSEYQLGVFVNFFKFLTISPM